MKWIKRILLIINSLLIAFLTLNIIFILKINYIKVSNYNMLKLKGNLKEAININEEFLDKDKKNIRSGKVDSSHVGKYSIKYCSKNKNIPCLYKIVTVKDKENPVIELLGDIETKIYVGDKYEEKGYKVMDNSGEELNDKVIITGEVNTKKTGEYILKYEVSDSSGNVSFAERKVIVKEKQISSKATITKEVNNEKGNANKKQVDLQNDSNNVLGMNFIENGIYIEGYVKDGNGEFTMKLCSSECIDIPMNKKDEKNYSGKIELNSLENGDYIMKINSNGEYDLIDNLEECDRIVRAKVGNKLIEFSYPNRNPKFTVKDFAYEYDILIDPGHGGSDNGATNSKTTEKALNLTQSLYEKSRYEQHGLKVMMTRTDDTYGIMMGSSTDSNVRRRGYTMGYYGAVSKFIYSNHHNSVPNDYSSGFEVLLPAKAPTSAYSPTVNIINSWKQIYPNLGTRTRVYTRDYNSGTILSKESGQIHNVKNWYAVIRVPYELYNVNVVLYEGCYLSNMDDYDWYIQNWKKLSEIKIKYYVESLGKTYIPVE